LIEDPDAWQLSITIGPLREGLFMIVDIDNPITLHQVKKQQE
jgi:hypothetical protein